MTEPRLTPISSANKEKGFTLIEVMIALAILSFIMIAVISITDSSQETASRVVSEDRELLQVETALSRLEWDFSQIWSPLHFSHEMQPIGLNQQSGQAYNQVIDRYSLNRRFAFPSYEGLPVPIFSLEEKNTLTIFTLSNRRKFKNSKQSHFQWVQYSLEQTPTDSQKQENDEEVKEDTFSLVRKVVNEDVFSPEELQWDDIKSQTLLRGVQSLIFELWNPQNRKWTDQISSIKNGRHKIHGLKVTMEWLDSDGITRKYIRVMKPLMPIHFIPENMYQLQGSANANSSQTTGTNGNSNESQQ